MRSFALLAVLALAALALAGCSDKGKDDDETSTSTSSSRSSSTSTSTSRSNTTTTASSTTTTGSQGNGTNRAPTASLAASVPNGTAPLRVNFTINGADADSDPLAWMLAFGDGNRTNGTGVPGAASHNYTAAGTFNATLTVSDGRANATSVVTIQVGGGAKAAFVINGTYTGVDPGAALPVGNPARQPSCITSEDGVGGNWHVYNQDLTGYAFTITPAKFVAVFYESDGATRTGTFNSSGVVPADSVEVDICTADPTAGGSYTFTATAP